MMIGIRPLLMPSRLEDISQRIMWGDEHWALLGGAVAHVEIVNDRNSVFAGVILPRSENNDDLHIVVKLFTGYNVGLAADRITSAKETFIRISKLSLRTTRSRVCGM